MKLILIISFTIITVAIVMWPITIGLIIKLFFDPDKKRKHHFFHSKFH